ncbi:MAG TPA: hypothetical protein VFG76_11610 [Candidatus Polarisedimenticolia bacterium]|nr:hypothetical protein [Candidatus Polarisedimenticolia bacterium]
MRTLYVGWLGGTPDLRHLNREVRKRLGLHLAPSARPAPPSRVVIGFGVGDRLAAGTPAENCCGPDGSAKRRDLVFRKPKEKDLIRVPLAELEDAPANGFRIEWEGEA